MCFLENDALKSEILTNTCSPYTEAPATLHIGPDKTVYFVPKNFLPAEWFSSGSQKPFCFPDVDIQTGHTLVHYLYKGNYETPAANDGPMSLHARTKLKAALLVYIAANDHALPGLQLLATSEIEEYGSRLDLIEILDAIDSDFPKLCRDSWVHEYLRRKAMAAFEQDHTVFTNEALFRDINNTVLLKFLMQCIFNLYKARLSHVLSTEKEQCHGLERQTQCAQDLLPDTNALALEQKREFIVPLADEVPLEQSCESDVEDVATSEDFCTISCPSSDSDCEAEAYPHNDATESNCETPRATVYDVCCDPCEMPEEIAPESEPAVSEQVPDSPQPVACEPTLEDEIVPASTECEAIENDAPPEQSLSHRTSSRPCFLQTTHILEGNGWEGCRRCRETVKSLAVQVKSCMGPEHTPNSQGEGGGR
jgi:hypothetical protein